MSYVVPRSEKIESRRERQRTRGDSDAPIISQEKKKIQSKQIRPTIPVFQHNLHGQQEPSTPRVRAPEYTSKPLFDVQREVKGQGVSNRTRLSSFYE